MIYLVIHLVIPGRPPAKNDHKRVTVRGGRPSLYDTKRAKAFYRAVEDALPFKPACITSGTWRCSIRACHDRRALVSEFDNLGGLDVDAPVALVLDALQRAEVIDDDARITELVVDKQYDKDNPRVEIWLEPN